MLGSLQIATLGSELRMRVKARARASCGVTGEAASKCAYFERGKEAKVGHEQKACLLNSCLFIFR